MRRLLLATNNRGKVEEFRRLLADVPYELVTSADVGLTMDVAETGTSYAENASLKARAYADAADCLALADDSGIEVDALDGEPGIYSARYGGPELDDRGRVNLLLETLHDVPPPGRTARFRAVVAIAEPGGEVRNFDGTWEGTIAAAPRGERGFGYDPVFLLPDGRTAAELSADEKDRLSHRGKAIRKAAEYLERPQ